MKAREWTENCSRGEWGNETMWRIAQERFAKDATIDLVRVYEHGGWSLTWNRAGVIIGTANDTASLSDDAYEWASQFTTWVCVGHTRRQDNGEHEDTRYPSYFPAMAQVA